MTQPKALTLLEAAVAAEAALGENIVWLNDELCAQVRDKDEDTLRRLRQLEDAWLGLCRAIKSNPP